MTHWKLTTLRKKSLVSISGKLFDFDRAFSNWDDGDSGCLEWSSQKKGALYWEGELSFRLKIVRTNSQVQTPVGGLGGRHGTGVTCDPTYRSLATLPPWNTKTGHLRPYLFLLPGPRKTRPGHLRPYPPQQGKTQGSHLRPYRVTNDSHQVGKGQSQLKFTKQGLASC